MDIDSLVQEKLDADTDFQTSLEGLSEEEQDAAIEAKRKEITAAEFAALSEKATKAEEVAGNQKQRAEKAEGELKTFKPKPAPAAPAAAQTDDLSPKDAAYLYSKVHEDDVEKVVEAMKVLKITDPKEALKHDVVTTILARETEHRKTEQANNTRAARQGAGKVSSDEIVRRANEGDIPEPGSKEAEELFWARRGGKRN